MSGFRQCAGSGHTAVMTSAAGSRGTGVATAPPPVAAVGAAASAAELRAARSALWLDDLRWHKQMFRQSRFQWTGEHAVDIITRHTGGQVEFTDVRQRTLERRVWMSAGDYVGHLSTVSAYLLLPEHRRARLLDRIAAVLPERVSVDGDLVLHLARRTGPT